MALTDNLISFWELGNVNDAHSTNNLSNPVSVAFVAGKVGNAADFEEGDGDYLTVAGNAALQTGDITYSVAGWVNFESIAGGIDHALISRWDSAVAGEREFLLAVDVLTTELRLRVADGGATTVGDVSASTFGTVSTATWYFVAAGHDATANEVWISVNAGTPNTAATSGASGVGASLATELGSRNLGTANNLDGLLDQWGFWKRDIRSDLATLYNGGAGLSYAAMSGGGGGGSSTSAKIIFQKA